MFGKINGELFPFLLVAGISLAAVYTDLRYGKIYNRLTFLGVLLGLLLSLVRWGLFSGAIFASQGFMVALLCFGLLYACRVVAAGDVKLLLAFGTALGAQQAFHIAVLSLLIGGVLAACALTIQRKWGSFLFRVTEFLVQLLRHPLRAQFFVVDLSLKMPFAVPLSSAALWVAWLDPWSVLW
jgi:prepilin peptidase CpaA